MAPSAERNQHLAQEIYTFKKRILGKRETISCWQDESFEFTLNVSLEKQALVTLFIIFRIHLHLLLGTVQDLTHSPQQQ